MREQDIAAIATPTPRLMRGQNKGRMQDGILRARQQGQSSVLWDTVTAVAKQLKQTRSFHDPAHSRLVETRQAIVAHWMKIADTLDAQGEVALAGDARYFAHHLPPLMTDKGKLAVQFMRHLEASRSPGNGGPRECADDRCR
jgi:hypothetical protein